MICVMCLIYKSKLYMKNGTKHKWDIYAVFMLTTKVLVQSTVINAQFLG